MTGAVCEPSSHAVLVAALRKAKNAGAVFMPTSGRFAEAVAALGAFHVCDRAGVTLKAVAFDPNPDPGQVPFLVVSGGSLVRGVGGERGERLIRYLEKGGSVCILPSTIIDFGRDLARFGERVFVFARERVTYNLLREEGFSDAQISLAPDLAFAIDVESLNASPQGDPQGTLYAIRGEEEAIFGPPSGSRVQSTDWSDSLPWQSWHERARATSAVKQLAQHIANHERVVTDRLHIAILGAKLKRDVTLRSAAFHKNKSVYEYTLSKEKGVRFEEVLPTRNFEKEEDSAPGWEGMRRHIAWYERMRVEWWEPELARLNAEIDRVKTSALEMRRLAADLKEAEHQLEEVVEPELRRLRAKHRLTLSQLDDLRTERDTELLPQLSRLREDVRHLVEARQKEHERAERLALELRETQERLTHDAEPEMARLQDLVRQMRERGLAQQAEAEASNRANQEMIDTLRRQLLEASSLGSHAQVELARLKEDLASAREIAGQERMRANTAKNEVSMLRTEATQLRGEMEALIHQLEAANRPGAARSHSTTFPDESAELAEMRVENLRLAGEAEALRKQLATLNSARTLRAARFVSKVSGLDLLRRRARHPVT